MTQNTDEELFWQITESIIDIANSKLEEVDPGIVLSAVIEASARFSAFYAASNSESKKDLAEDKNDIIQRLGAEFKRKLADGLTDYIDNYKTYMKTDESKS